MGGPVCNGGALRCPRDGGGLADAEATLSDAPSWLDLLDSMDKRMARMEDKLDRSIQQAAAHDEALKGLRYRLGDTEEQMREAGKRRHDYDGCCSRHDALEEAAATITAMRQREVMVESRQVAWYRTASFWVSVGSMLIAAGALSIAYHAAPVAAAPPAVHAAVIP